MKWLMFKVRYYDYIYILYTTLTDKCMCKHACMHVHGHDGLSCESLTNLTCYFAHALFRSF